MAGPEDSATPPEDEREPQLQTAAEEPVDSGRQDGQDLDPAPGSAWEQLNEEIRQAYERDHPFAPPVPPAAAPDGLEPLAQLVDLVGKFPKPALALWCEQQIRSGRITVHGIQSPTDLLSYRPYEVVTD